MKRLYFAKEGERGREVVIKETERDEKTAFDWWFTYESYDISVYIGSILTHWTAEDAINDARITLTSFGFLERK